MPLPPLPDNNTARLWVEYDTTVGIHELLFRQHSAATKSDFITQVRQFCTQLVGLVNSSGGFTSARYAAAGSDISNPESWAAINGTNATAPSVLARPIFATFSGRTATGRKARLYFFTPYINFESDFRLELADNTALANARAILESPTRHIGAIDGTAPIWYPYFNIGFNAYHQRKARQFA